MDNSKKKNKKRKKLRTLILLLFLTIIMFGTSTYAWFTANRIVNIENIDVHVETSDGLQISTDGTTWKSVITKDDITNHAYSGALNFIPNTLDAVSTNGDTTDDGTGKTRRLNMFASNIGSDIAVNGGAYTIYTTQVPEATDHTKFIAFDIFLKVSSDKPVFLNSANDSFSNVVKRADTETVQYADRGLKNAARVAFVPIGEADATASQSDIISAYYTSDAPDAKIWEPNNDVHASAVVNSVGPEYGFKNATALSLTSSTPVTYYGMKVAIPQADKTDLIGTVNGTVTTFGASNTVFSDAMSEGTVTNTAALYSTTGRLISTPQTFVAGKDYQIFTLKRGITKMRVYMWIEGQDIDCENNASGTDITYNIELSIRETPAATTTPTP